MTKFETLVDAELYAIDEGLIEPKDIGVYDLEQLTDLSESVTKRRLLERKELVNKKVDSKRSRETSRNWKLKRNNYMSGIKRFNKSIKGKRVHQKVAQARADGKLRSSIYEDCTTINSIITRLTINAGYNSTVEEEATNIALLHEGYELLNPVLDDLINGRYTSMNERLLLDDSGLFIDDLFGISEDIDYSPGELGAVEILNNDEIEDKLSREGYDPSKVAADLKNGDPDPNEDDTTSTEDENKGTSQDDEARESSKADGEEGTGAVSSDKLTEDFSVDSDNQMFDIVESMNDLEVNPNSYVMISEAASDPDVDGVHIIAKIVGPAFFPGSVSRNNVEYTKEFWDTVLKKPEVISEMRARRMYGTFGHEQKIDDEALRKGLVSHIVSKAYMKTPDVGYCEYLVLNTEAGRNLKTYFGAKSRIRVSTRGKGTFKTVSNSRGHKEPDANTFLWQGVDFVHDPGFINAEPTMA